MLSSNSRAIQVGGFDVVQKIVTVPIILGVLAMSKSAGPSGPIAGGHGSLQHLMAIGVPTRTLYRFRCTFSYLISCVWGSPARNFFRYRAMIVTALIVRQYVHHYLKFGPLSIRSHDVGFELSLESFDNLLHHDEGFIWSR